MFGPPVADGPLGQRIKAAAQQAADLKKGRKPGDCRQDNRGIKFQLTHPVPRAVSDVETYDTCGNEPRRCRIEDETARARRSQPRATADELERTRRKRIR
ncbi:hypothetical protein T02_6356 [Trichinella nativa]|uniref:Uncharacterized protein n=1 Tax=Trichinella nativa TaxID=6335 RepID=A0A0V1L9B8_9BILA|nr:hypothetical protein T02_248 [Trichinella nativa]KRZ56073.1 hypothetical protein T02_6356 [Trichinella nativa]